MIIDVHTHPAFIKDIFDFSHETEKRNIFGLYKVHVEPLDLHIKQMDNAGVDKEVLLPLDSSCKYNGEVLMPNELIKTLVDMAPDRCIGVASVAPHDPTAVEKLDYAVKDHGLRGLKLNPSSQDFYPNDKAVYPIYEKALELNIPIIFHAGMSWEPNANSKYSQPIHFEDVAIDFPELKFSLAHFAWPWMTEAAMLAVKYPNVYVDTALLYFDAPVSFFEHCFSKEVKATWIDRSLNTKVMFGSNYPRIEQHRMRSALEAIGLREEMLARVLGGNAQVFLGLDK